MKDYHINIFYNEEDEAYIADTPDMKYCSAIGETPQQALNEVILAKTAWLEAARAENKTIPKPRYRPVIYQIVALERK
jgi:predicted RNase H-like HicB family nuclease